MENVFSQLLTFQFLILCVVIGGIIGSIAQIGSKKDEATGKRVGGIKTNVWFQRLNPLFPYVLGVGLCCIPGIPLPAGLPATWGAKIMFGLLAAIFSDKAYTVVKKVLVSRLEAAVGKKGS